MEERAGGALLGRVGVIRRQIAGELGMVIPPVRIHDEVGLNSHEYVVKVRGQAVARDRVLAGHQLAMDPGDAMGQLAGVPTTETGLRAARRVGASTRVAPRPRPSDTRGHAAIARRHGGSRRALALRPRVTGGALARVTTGDADTLACVPTISTFYGILIRMYYGDHPPPHFHARYAEHQARCAIATGEVIDGELPARAQRLVREWASLRQAELEDNWRRCEERVPLCQVEPLP